MTKFKPTAPPARPDMSSNMKVEANAEERNPPAGDDSTAGFSPERKVYLALLWTTGGILVGGRYPVLEPKADLISPGSLHLSNCGIFRRLSRIHPNDGSLLLLSRYSATLPCHINLDDHVATKVHFTFSLKVPNSRPHRRSKSRP